MVDRKHKQKPPLQRGKFRSNQRVMRGGRFQVGDMQDQRRDGQGQAGTGPSCNRGKPYDQKRGNRWVQKDFPHKICHDSVTFRFVEMNSSLAKLNLSEVNDGENIVLWGISPYILGLTNIVNACSAGLSQILAALRSGL